MTHHEWSDGSGYPGHLDLDVEYSEELYKQIRRNPLKGEEIPLFGRIVSIADVFDALLSRRVYKNDWDEEDVLGEFKKSSGTQFDPELVEIFFEVLPHLLQIRKRYPESH